MMVWRAGKSYRSIAIELHMSSINELRGEIVELTIAEAQTSSLSIFNGTCAPLFGSS
jgi:hypothetical protein